MQKFQKIAIIGPGRLGKTLAGVFFAAGLKLAAIGARDVESSHDFAALYSLRAVSPAQAAMAGDVVFLCVNDDSIQPVCEELVRQGAFSHRPLVVHCSGAAGSEVLASAADVGCDVASFHPLQTFPDDQAGLTRWNGTHCFVESPSIQARDFLKNLAGKTGACGIDIEPQAKALYHAASVVSCNYLTALMDVALDMYARAGIDKAVARQAIEPIVRATVENVLAKGPTDALTGPVARGDVATVEKHLQAIDDDETKKIYKTLGLRAAEIALRNSDLDGETIKNIRRIEEILGD